MYISLYMRFCVKLLFNKINKYNCKYSKNYCTIWQYIQTVNNSTIISRFLYMLQFLYQKVVCRQVHLPRINKKKGEKSPSSHHPHPHCVCCGDSSCCHASHGPSWQGKARIKEYYWGKTSASCTGQSWDVGLFSIHTFSSFRQLERHI